MGVQCQLPWAKGMGEGGGGGGGGRSWRVMFEYVDFRHFDFRGIN